MPISLYVVFAGLAAVAVASFGSFGAMISGTSKVILAELARMAIAGVVVAFCGLGLLLLEMIWSKQKKPPHPEGHDG